MNFEFTADEATSFEIPDGPVEKGITFVDTADVYGDRSPGMAVGFGHLGTAWLKRSGRRDDVVLATKA